MTEKLPIRQQNTAGQTRETIDFTSNLVKLGKMTPEEKLRLDNLSILANSLANLAGFETYSEEKPNEWQEFLLRHKKNKKKHPPPET